MRKKRSYRWNTLTGKKEAVDEIDNAIDRISRKDWENTYQEEWAKAAKRGEWERLRGAIRMHVQAYMDNNPGMTPQEAVAALRRSRYYTTQADYFRRDMYYKIVNQGWNRDPKTGRFALKKSNIYYMGKFEKNDVTYTQYKYVLNNGDVWYTYEAESPKDPMYAFKNDTKNWRDEDDENAEN